MTKQKRKGVHGRNKGQRGEREVAKRFANWWGSEFVRTPMSGGFHTPKFRQDWNAEGDVVTADETFPFSVEVKWHEGWTLDMLITSSAQCIIWRWWEQTLRQSDGKIPLLVFKRNHQPWYFCMPSVYYQEFLGRKIHTRDHKATDVVVGLLKDLHATEPEIWLDDQTLTQMQEVQEDPATL